MNTSQISQLYRVNISRLYQLPKGEYIRSSNCFPGSVSRKELFRHPSKHFFYSLRSIYPNTSNEFPCRGRYLGPGILTKKEKTMLHESWIEISFPFPLIKNLLRHTTNICGHVERHFSTGQEVPACYSASQSFASQFLKFFASTKQQA